MLPYGVLEGLRRSEARITTYGLTTRFWGAARSKAYRFLHRLVTSSATRIADEVASFPLVHQFWYVNWQNSIGVKAPSHNRKREALS
jgi:hypothetical protein